MNRQPSTISGPRLALACAAIRRVQANEKYIPRDYEVCLVREGRGQEYAFPNGKVSFEQEPVMAALDNLKQQTKLVGTTAYPLKVYGKPYGMEHIVTIFYGVPVSCEDRVQVHSSMEGGFHSLEEVLENKDGKYKMHYGHREMLYSLDQWLRERHVIPFVNPELTFLCSREGEGVGGLVKAIIDNPLYGTHVRPPEDELVISLNNPVFQTNSSQELDTALTSTA